MTLPSFAQLKALNATGAGLVPETLEERLLTLLAIQASGQNPDGTTWPGPVPAGTYVGVGNGREAAGLLWAFAGDSIFVGTGAGNTNYAVCNQAVLMAGGTIARPDSINSGVNGNTSASLVARIGRLLTQNPQATVILIGTNDAGSAVSPDTYAANLVSLIKSAKSVGPVVLCTVPPRGSAASAAIQQLTQAYNIWIKLLAATYDCQVADTYSAVVDTTTGYLAAANDSGDGVHPTNLGHAKLGAEIAKAMKRATARTTPFGLVTSIGAQAANLIADPLNARASVLSGGWTEWAGGSGTAPTYSFVSDSSGTLPAGQWAQMDFNGTVGGVRRLTSPAQTTGFAVGDKMILATHLQVQDLTATWPADVAAGNAGIYLTAIDQGAAAFATMNAILDHVPGIPEASAPTVYDFGPVVFPFTIPAACTQFQIWFSAVVPTGKHYQFRLGATGIFDLNTLQLTNQVPWAGSMLTYS